MSDRDSRVLPSSHPGRITSLYIALTPVLAAFLLIPLELYSTAAEYWRWNSSFPLRFGLFGLLLYGGLLLLLTALGTFSKRLMGRTALLLFYLGLLVLLADVLAPLQTGLLDGSGLESEEPLAYTLIELGLLGFVVFLALKLGANAPRVAVLMTTFILLTSAGYTLYAGTLRPPDSHQLPARAAPRDISGNVYHIVLDEMQTDVAQAYLHSRQLQEDFDGFTFYRNNITNYLFTNVSMPSYLTGRLYKSGDFTGWQESFKEDGLFRHLYDAGYKVRLYSVYDHWCSPYAQQCRSLDQVFEQHTGLLGSEFITFIQIWFARITPNFVTNWALAQGKRLGNTVDQRLNAAADDIPRTIARGRAPYSSILMLDELIQGEAEQAASGRYIYAHTIIPHGPYVMNADCDYDATLWKREGGQRAYYQQAACTLDKVAEFLAELKKLGRYDNATIVVHADTGHGHMGFLDFDQDGQLLARATYDSPVMELDAKFRKTEEWYLSRAMALLMVKPPLARGDMTMSDEMTQLTDVYPTVMELAGLALPGGLDGRALPAGTGTDDRAPIMFFTTPARPGDITTLTISDQADIRHSRLLLADRDSQEQADQYSVVLGLDDGLVLEGFSYPEHSADGSRHWRWVMGTVASVNLSPRLYLAAGNYTVEVDVEPFANNKGTVAGVSIGSQRQDFELEEGWQRYRLNFSLRGDEVARLQFEFASAMSPKSLGISADQRELAARIGRIEVRPADG
jgi:hypothetical protein